MRISFIFIILFLFSCQKDSSNNVEFSFPSSEKVIHSSEFVGKNIYLFFGFTHCPHVCPKIFKTLKTFLDKQQDSEVIFITVDPKRDTTEHLKEYFKNYPKNFHFGVFQNEKELKGLMTKFGASYTYYSGDTAEAPIIDHTSNIFVLNKTHQWVDSLPYDVDLKTLDQKHLDIFRRTPINSPHRSTVPNSLGGMSENCNLSERACSVGGVTLDIRPRPISTLTNLTITLLISEPLLGTPLYADFIGEDINMGYIRPEFRETAPHTYEAKVNLPLCETPKMSWKLTVPLRQPKEKETKDYIFLFSTIK